MDAKIVWNMIVNYQTFQRQMQIESTPYDHKFIVNFRIKSFLNR